MLSPGIMPQAIVEHHDVQRVQELAFVFVDAFDVRVENGVRVDDLAGRGFKPIGETHFCVAFGPAHVARKALSSARGFSSDKLVEIGDPTVADGVGDDLRRAADWRAEEIGAG